MRKCVLLLSILCLAALSSAVFAQTGDVVGTVRCLSVPVADAVVGIKASAGATADAIMYAETDENGSYTLANVPTGTYYVAAWKEGMTPTADTVITLSESEVEVLDFQLTTLAGTNIVEGTTAFLVSNQDPWEGMWGDKALDGDVGSYWATEWDRVDNDYLIVDLDPVGGSTVPISGITIWWADGMPLQYQVQAMVGGDPLFEDWNNPGPGVTVTTIYETTGTNAYQMPGMDITWVDPIRLDGAAARGLRLLMPPGWVSHIACDTVREFQVHSTDTVEVGVIQGTAKCHSIPIADAVVGIKTSPTATADPLMYTTTDENGNYTVTINPGTYYVAAWTDGMTPTADVVVELSSGEVEVVDLQLTTLAGTNIVEGATAYLESNVAWGSGDEFDGNIDTFWATENDRIETDYLIVDLDPVGGSSVPISGITIWWADGMPLQYQVQAMVGGDPLFEDWNNPGPGVTVTTIYETTGTNPYEVPGMGITWVDPIRLDGVSARGLRLLMPPGWVSWIACDTVREFQVHGTDTVEVGVIQGTVTYSGMTIPGAAVGIKPGQNAAADALVYATTGENGSYAAIVPSGSYYVAAWAPGWTPSADVGPLNIAEGQVGVADLVLTTTEGNNLSRDDGDRIAVATANSEWSDRHKACNVCDSQFDDIPTNDNNYWNIVSLWACMDNPLLPVTLTLDLNENTFEETYPISAITIYWGRTREGEISAMDVPKSYTIEVTPDDPSTPFAVWTTVYSTTSGNGWQTAIDEFAFGVFDWYSNIADPIKLSETINARGVRLIITELAPNSTSCGIRDLRVHSAETYENLVIGKVTDETSGNPIADALVHFGDPEIVGGDCFIQRLTDAAGYYAFSVNEPGQPMNSGYNFLTADAWQYANVDTVVNLPGDGTPVVQNFALPPKAEISLFPNWNAENSTPPDPPVDWVLHGDPVNDIWEASEEYNHTPGGLYSGKVTHTIETGGWAEIGYRAEMIPIDPTKCYNMWSYQPINSGDICYILEFLDENGNWVEGKDSWYNWNIVTERTAYKFILYRATPPPNAAYLNAYCFHYLYWGEIDSIWFDDIVVEEVDVPPPPTIGELKTLDDGMLVNISGKRLTALVGYPGPADQGNGGFPDNTGYIEEVDRSAGIRVDITNATGDLESWFSVGPGDAVNILGVVGTTAQSEKYLDVQNVLWAGDTRPLDCLAMNLRFANTGLAQGLLVKVTGNVTSVGTDSFTITDGSVDATGAPIYMTVKCGTLTKPSVGETVRVRGVISTDGTSAVLLMRNEQVDIADGNDAIQPLPIQGPVKALRDYLLIGTWGNDELIDVDTQMATDWLSQETGGAITETTVRPSLGDTVGAYTWFRHDGEDEVLDLTRMFGPVEFCTCYLHVYVYSPIGQYVDIPLGSDESVKVWVNGNLVWTNIFYPGAGRGANYGDDLISNVWLDAGLNSVLIKVHNNQWGYGIVTQFAEPGTWTGPGWGGSTPKQGLGYLLNLLVPN